MDAVRELVSKAKQIEVQKLEIERKERELDDARREVVGRLQHGHEVFAVLGRRLGHQRNRHIVGIERNTVTEQDQEEDGHQEGDGDAAWIAYDLQELLAQESAQAHRRSAAWLARGAHVVATSALSMS